MEGNFHLSEEDFSGRDTQFKLKMILYLMIDISHSRNLMRRPYISPKNGRYALAERIQRR